MRRADTIIAVRIAHVAVTFLAAQDPLWWTDWDGSSTSVEPGLRTRGACGALATYSKAQERHKYPGAGDAMVHEARDATYYNRAIMSIVLFEDNGLCLTWQRPPPRRASNTCPLAPDRASRSVGVTNECANKRPLGGGKRSTKPDVKSVEVCVCPCSRQHRSVLMGRGERRRPMHRICMPLPVAV